MSSSVAAATTPIDLTQDNHEVASAASPVDLTQEEDEELHLIGSCTFTIVGIRYYTGTAHPGEYVHLVREPHNPHDRNAIRVDNMSNLKVGHIKREQAAVLAPLMDKLGDGRIQIDGTIPSAGNHWNLPVRIDVYAQNSNDSLAIVQVNQKMEHFFLMYQRSNQGNSYGGSSSRVATAPIVQVQKKTIDWRTQQRELDALFEAQTKSQLSNLPTRSMPHQFLTHVQLFAHQELGILWMVHREISNIPAPFYKQVMEGGKKCWLSEITNSSQAQEPKSCKGGILADEMGLGKTIQALGLILLNPPQGHVYPDGIDSATPVVSPPAQDADKKPAAAVVSEMGLPTTKTAIQKIKIDVLRCVLNNAGMPSSGKKADLVHVCWTGIFNRTITAQHFAIGAAAANDKPASLSSRAVCSSSVAPVCTLIVCPVSVVSNWVHQIDLHIKKSVIRYDVYSGSDRDAIRTRVQENQVDVLIVSYNTLASDFSKIQKDKENVVDGNNATKKRKHNQGTSSLFDIAWHRIILDEAHNVRNTETLMFRSVKALKSERRFCLTGTPLQNKPDDIHSLFSFLAVEPLGNKDVFRRSISQPIQTGDEMGLTRLRTMMAHVALRRNKAMANLKMPEKEVQLRSISFPDGSMHRSVHDALFETAQAAFQATLLEGDEQVLKNYTSVFETLLRIRQACCSGVLVPTERRERAEAVLKELQSRNGKALTAQEGKALLEKLKGTFQQDDDQQAPECAVCLCEMDESAAVILRTCSHVFCEPCIAQVQTNHNSTCPLCRTGFGQADMIKKSAAFDAVKSPSGKQQAASIASDDNIGSSPKVDALLEGIKEIQSDEKGVIFSQFTKFLDVLEKYLYENGHTYTRIDGKKSASERIKAMQSFNSENDGPRFILCSLHAAGTGINLTRGNWIFMMDTWWNKAVENQAMDRVHRIGQKRKVRVVRYVMENSIEARMVEIQEAKAAMGKGAIEKLKPDELRKARIGDLKSLFQIQSLQTNAIAAE